MRTILLMAAALLLAGCSDVGLDDVWGSAPSEALPDKPLVASASVEPAAIEICNEAAQARSTDAARQGFDETVQRTVYNDTYADCVAWAQRRLR